MVKDINKILTKYIIEGGDNGNGDLLDTNCAHPVDRSAYDKDIIQCKQIVNRENTVDLTVFPRNWTKFMQMLLINI